MHMKNKKFVIKSCLFLKCDTCCTILDAFLATLNRYWINCGNIRKLAEVKFMWQELWRMLVAVNFFLWTLWSIDREFTVNWWIYKKKISAWMEFYQSNYFSKGFYWGFKVSFTYCVLNFAVFGTRWSIVL